MKKKIIKYYEALFKTLFTHLLILVLPAIVNAQKSDNPADFVNPLIGTAPLEDLSLYGGTNYVPDPGEMGFSGLVYPGASMPFGMVKLSPLTEVIFPEPYVKWTHGSGYYYSDSTIVGFAHTNKGHWSAGNILVIPTVGKLQTIPGTSDNPDGGFRSRFIHEQESARAGYYSVYLKDYGIQAELTATRYVGFHRYTFPGTSDGHILLAMNHAIENVKHAAVEIIDDQHIQGVQNGVYFYAAFSKPFMSYGIWEDDKICALARHASGENIGVYVDYQTYNQEQIDIKVGLSYVSMEKARKNLEEEAGQLSFEEARNHAWENWNRKLGIIEVQGGTQEEKTNFYTSLYRAMLWPAVLSDVDGQYRIDEEIYYTNREYYAAPPLWDAFRNHMPLLTIIEPQVKLNILRSFLARAEKKGWMDTQFQGNHAASVFASSLLAGLDDFDVKKAYYFLKRNQTDTAGPLQYLHEFINLGYIATVEPPPDDCRTAPHKSSVAKTLEYSYDAYCLGIMAEKLQKNDESKIFLEYAGHYKNVYDSSTGFMRGKIPDGTWITPFDPQKPRFKYIYREANAWQQTWFVPHDIQGLVRLMGGKDDFTKKLDEFFNTPYEPECTLIDIAGMIGQYAHSNQPDHHVPYLYNYAGEPWKTQKIVREIMDKMYRGLVYTGMDDCGEMSSWYVWSAMGFYPVSPVHLTFALGSPLFEKIIIHLPQYHNGDRDFILIARNSSKENKYIQSARINHMTYDKPWISYNNIIAGDTVIFEMVSAPNTSWGIEQEDAPPSRPVVDKLKIMR